MIRIECRSSPGCRRARCRKPLPACCAKSSCTARPAREEVAFRPRERATFSRRDARTGRLIHNVIGEDASGALTPTSSSEVSPGPGSADDAVMDAAAAARRCTATLRVAQATLDAIRRTAAP